MKQKTNASQKLLAEILRCQICSSHLEFGVRPIVSFHPKSKIVIIGQAPGSVVHRTGKPWDDKSGERLRLWMGIDDKIFYDNKIVSIVPMGFCYPGKGKSGDLPPRKECAPAWHAKILESLMDLKLVLLIGKYAQDYYLKENAKKNLTETVRFYSSYLPKYFVLPHPSPRNNIWMKKNEWFERDVIPELKKSVNDILGKQSK